MGPCFEFPIPASQFTPEKGREQLARMRACYDRERLKRTIMFAVMFGATMVLALIFLVMMIVRGAL